MSAATATIAVTEAAVATPGTIPPPLGLHARAPVRPKVRPAWVSGLLKPSFTMPATRAAGTCCTAWPRAEAVGSGQLTPPLPALA